MWLNALYENRQPSKPRMKKKTETHDLCHLHPSLYAWYKLFAKENYQKPNNSRGYFMNSWRSVSYICVHDVSLYVQIFRLISIICMQFFSFLLHNPTNLCCKCFTAISHSVRFTRKEFYAMLLTLKMKFIHFSRQSEYILIVFFFLYLTNKTICSVVDIVKYESISLSRVVLIKQTTVLSTLIWH